MSYNFKSIQAVPNAKQFVDVVLSKTQRKTPTEIHPGYKISRIRKFYMRKVKYTQQTLQEKLQKILTDFPMLDQIHPFYADLMNVLYDRDHYKLALGQLNVANTLIRNVAKDYVKLLKFGDSLYRCKQLKRAALGRMMKILSKNASSFSYLEEVRLHIARLPSIDPNTRTILVCGFPNVGKSSFMKKVTRAQVDVQDYAFTTKSLFLGHLDYKQQRWQVIDMPGILDKPLEERNTIEMQSITALAHLRAAILYFIDISETCGYSIEQQCDLFKSLKPLFVNKPAMVIMTKTDLIDPNNLSDENKTRIEHITTDKDIVLLPMSVRTEQGVADVCTAACEALLQHRATTKLKAPRMADLQNRMHLAMPVPRDHVPRVPNIPATVSSSTQSKSVAKQRQEEWQRQQELYYDFDDEYTGINARERYLLEDPDWRFDKVPEIYEGKNVFDFWSPNDIEEKMDELERQELVRLREYEAQIAELEELNAKYELSDELKEKLRKIKKKRDQLMLEKEWKKKTRFTPLARDTRAYQGKPRTIQNFERHLEELGYDSTLAVEGARERNMDEDRARSRSQSRARSLSIARSNSSDGRSESQSRPLQKRSRKEYERSLTPKPGEGYKDLTEKLKARDKERDSLKRFRQDGRQGESDRRYYEPKPRHLFSGKMGFSRDRR